MTERVDGAQTREICVAGFLDKISKAFDVKVDTDGEGIAVTGDDNLSVLRAKNSLEALTALSSEDEIDLLMVDYVIYLSQTGKLEDFMKIRGDVFYVTPTGNSVKPKTLGQCFYIDALKRSEVVICAGPAGTGKTFLGVAAAVKALKNREVSRLILTRPAIEAGERLGFLPGDIEEKVDPYMRPLYDALGVLLGREVFERYYEKGIIEVSPLAFMRGRNLDDSYLVLDEAQNTTPEQMKMFLTRIGINCRACVCGDFTQIDLPRGQKSGLSDAMDVLAGVSGISLISMNNSDIVRNSLVGRILAAYDSYEGDKKDD